MVDLKIVCVNYKTVCIALFSSIFFIMNNNGHPVKTTVTRYGYLPEALGVAYIPLVMRQRWRGKKKYKKRSSGVKMISWNNVLSVSNHIWFT